jgi:hypothetical protein
LIGAWFVWTAAATRFRQLTGRLPVWRPSDFVKSGVPRYGTFYDKVEPSSR